jgi:hypothetical protein
MPARAKLMMRLLRRIPRGVGEKGGINFSWSFDFWAATSIR